MCPSSGELLYQCDTWCMLLCVDDLMMGTWLPETCKTCIPDGHLHKVT